MENRPKRPASVWIAQILLTIPALAVLFMFFMILLNLPIALRSFGIIAIIPLIISGFFSGLCFVAVWGMAKRKSYGRWTGVASLSVMFLMSIVGQIVRPQGPMQYYEYKNDAERFGGFIGSTVIWGLFLWLILHVALSKRVTKFFAPIESPLSDVPPPPPSFDE